MDGTGAATSGEGTERVGVGLSEEEARAQPRRRSQDAVMIEGSMDRISQMLHNIQQMNEKADKETEKLSQTKFSNYRLERRKSMEALFGNEDAAAEFRKRLETNNNQG
eukprot:Rmarinus@m.2439